MHILCICLAVRIEWNAAKAALNQRKHGVRFADIEPVFWDPYSLWIPDPGPAREERFVRTGQDALGRVVTVNYTWRGEVVRIISARKATARERAEYARRIRLL